MIFWRVFKQKFYKNNLSDWLHFWHAVIFKCFEKFLKKCSLIFMENLSDAPEDRYSGSLPWCICHQISSRLHFQAQKLLEWEHELGQEILLKHLQFRKLLKLNGSTNNCFETVQISSDWEIFDEFWSWMGHQKCFDWFVERFNSRTCFTLFFRNRLIDLNIFFKNLNTQTTIKIYSEQFVDVSLSTFKAKLIVVLPVPDQEAKFLHEMK